MEIGSEIIFFLVVTIGFTLSGVIGFGANVLTLPILSLFFEISDLVVVLAVISFTNAVYRVYESRAGILWKKLGMMLLVSLPGAMMGLWLLESLPEDWMKLVLGVFVVVIAWYHLRCNTEIKTQEALEQESKKETVFYHILLFIGGVLQGAFICGGPLYVIYCSHYFGHTRLQFRGMQFGILLVNSCYIFLSYLLRGAYTKELMIQSAVGLTGFLTAVVVSAIVLRRIKDTELYRLIQIVLGISGISLVIQAGCNLIS